MIGKTITFIREKWKVNGHGIEANLEYTGVVLDKATGVERIEGRFYRADYYMVELPDGIVAKFWCDEAVRIVKPKPETNNESTMQLQYKEDL